MKRRDILKGMTLLPIPLATGFIGKAAAIGETAASPPKTSERDLFGELGVTRVINASVTMTFLSGSLMLPEV